MPKVACRIFLKILDMYPERLHDITDEDAIKEGIGMCTLDGCENLYECYTDFMGFIKPKASFLSLWEMINGEESVLLNPWVWVIVFERIEQPKEFLCQ